MYEQSRIDRTRAQYFKGRVIMKVMHLSILVLAFSVSSCGKFSRIWTSWTGDLTEKCARTGVVYLQSDSGIALLVDGSGKPIICNP